MSKHSFRLVLLAAVASAGLGCGGGLKYRVEDSAMDSVPASERQALSAARQDYEKAQGEKKLLERQRDPLDHDHDLAEKERQQIQLDIDRAIAEQETAVKTRDETRSNAAERAKEVADVAMKTAEARLDWLGQKSDWLKVALRAADARIDAAAAKVELEKARIAKQKGIKTRDDQGVGSFESQWEDKASDFQSARDQAAEEEKKAKDLEQKWQNLRTQHDKLKGT
jgi:chromosome segregation ATPase